VRKKKKGGVVSIQIIDKSSGIYELYRTIGSSKEPAEIERLYKEGKKEIESITGQQKLPFDNDKEKELIDIFFNGVEDFKLTGPELLLGKLFDEIGFDKIPDELFRHLVIARLVYPISKLKTVDYIFKYKGIIIDVEKVYRYLDKLQTQQIQLIQQISYQHTLKISDNYISIVFKSGLHHILRIFFMPKIFEDKAIHIISILAHTVVILFFSHLNWQFTITLISIDL